MASRRTATEKSQPLAVSVPTALLERLDAASVASNLNRSALVRLAIESYLDADSGPTLAAYHDAKSAAVNAVMGRIVSDLKGAVVGIVSAALEGSQGLQDSISERTAPAHAKPIGRAAKTTELPLPVVEADGAEPGEWD